MYRKLIQMNEQDKYNDVWGEQVLLEQHGYGLL